MRCCPDCGGKLVHYNGVQRYEGISERVYTCVSPRCGRYTTWHDTEHEELAQIDGNRITFRVDVTTDQALARVRRHLGNSPARQLFEAKLGGRDASWTWMQYAANHAGLTIDWRTAPLALTGR